MYYNIIYYYLPARLFPECFDLLLAAGFQAPPPTPFPLPFPPFSPFLLFLLSSFFSFPPFPCTRPLVRLF